MSRCIIARWDSPLMSSLKLWGSVRGLPRSCVSTESPIISATSGSLESVYIFVLSLLCPTDSLCRYCITYVTVSESSRYGFYV